MTTVLLLAAVLGVGGIKAKPRIAFPEPTAETRPWGICHLMGNAVEKAELAKEMHRWSEAGLGGVRLVPITLNTPKPLVRVNGVRIIDRLIDACHAAGIEEIYIVRGYLAELFDQLLYKYPNIRFLENPKYTEANNIGSALIALELL